MSAWELQDDDGADATGSQNRTLSLEWTENQNHGRQSFRSSFVSLMFRAHISAQSLYVVAKSFRDVPLSLQANPRLELQNILRPLPSMSIRHQCTFRHRADDLLTTSLTLRLLMSYIYIYGAPILDVSRSHTTTQHSR